METVDADIKKVEEFVKVEAQIIYSSEELHALLGVTPQRRRRYQKIMEQACKEVRSPEYKNLGFTPRQESWEPNQVEALFNFRKLFLPVHQGGMGYNEKRAYRYVKKNGIPLNIVTSK